MAQVEANKVNNSVIRRDRFVKIAERRVNKILENFNNLGKCSNKRNYDYSEADIRKIFREIERKVKETKLLFQGKSNNQLTFKL